MFDFIIKKFVPFGLARTLSLAGIPILQFAVMIFSTREEAGRFYFISNAAIVASQIADIGVSRAFPVLFGADQKHTHQHLPEIMSMRILLGIILGFSFMIFNSFGSISWNWQTTGVLALFFCFGRIILLGNQGCRHARQDFDMLLRGSVFHIIAAFTYLAVCAYAGVFSAEIAFAALTVGIWVELIVINTSDAHPYKIAGNNFKDAFKTVLPFATLGISQAVYTRVETFVSGKLLEPSALGVFGTLDSAFKMSIWPSYVSAQTVFPAINHAVQKNDKQELIQVAWSHFRLGYAICFAAMLITFTAWYFRFSGDLEVSIGALILWLSIWMTVPNAFMIPLFYSFKLERKLASAMVQLSVLRILVAVLLTVYFGFVGLCATHAIVTFCAVVLLWNYLKGSLTAFTNSSSVEDNS
ncbi:MAG: hypothetical protein Kow0029_04600 [Candidatus Rifleibacteriota bacterium]